MSTNLKTIDYGIISEDEIRIQLDVLPSDIKILSFVCRQLISKNKCIDIVYNIIDIIFKSPDRTKFIRNITNSSLVQSQDVNIFNYIYEKLEKIDFNEREIILQDVLQNVCTTVSKITLYELTEKIIDISFKDNLIWFLLYNNNSENLCIITNRPDVKAKAIFKGHTQILELFDPQKFRKEYPEFWL
jgi:hypothetical protein